MYGVGVGSGVDMNELSGIASVPKGRYVLHAESYGSLSSLSGVLSAKLCNGCLTKADIAFVVDSSSSIDSGTFHKLENVLKTAVTKMDIGPDKVHVGLMQYSSYPSIQFPLTQYTTRADALKAVEKMSQMSGSSNTADAIKFASNQIFSQNSGARPNVPRIEVVLTDGNSINNAATTTQADKARQNNIGMISVGIGNRVNNAELNSIADDNSKVVLAGSISDPDAIVDQILQKACQGSSGSSQCVDKVKNCRSYSKSVCTNYAAWAGENCKAFCGICQTTTAPCKDKISQCASYGHSACTQYKEWANDNCKQFCGFCSK
ncbi:hypothetical protein FSP39_022007 [Pinctada imbricata]|uniref:COL6A n=1 Tax=Pinctada imbricata TaxID=66713 RepID=A0AA88Y093_PINIB|nr:hypothetical protein FSP39_022007 [Pinctada imbricata]